jgi:hypothetical protein
MLIPASRNLLAEAVASGIMVIIARKLESQSPPDKTPSATDATVRARKKYQ